MKDINDSTNEVCPTLQDMTDTMYVETLELFPTHHEIRKISDQIDKLIILWRTITDCAFVHHIYDYYYCCGCVIIIIIIVMINVIIINKNI